MCGGGGNESQTFFVGKQSGGNINEVISGGFQTQKWASQRCSPEKKASALIVGERSAREEIGTRRLEWQRGKIPPWLESGKFKAGWEINLYLSFMYFYVTYLSGIRDARSLSGSVSSLALLIYHMHDISMNDATLCSLVVPVRKKKRSRLCFVRIPDVCCFCFPLRSRSALWLMRIKERISP